MGCKELVSDKVRKFMITNPSSPEEIRRIAKGINDDRMDLTRRGFPTEINQNQPSDDWKTAEVILALRKIQGQLNGEIAPQILSGPTATDVKKELTHSLP